MFFLYSLSYTIIVSLISLIVKGFFRRRFIFCEYFHGFCRFRRRNGEKGVPHPQAAPPEGGECVQGEPSWCPCALNQGTGYRFIKRYALPTSSSTTKKTPIGVFFVVEEDGFEPSKSLTTDLQSAPFGHSGTPPYLVFGLRWWSWWTDSNPRPADYKSAALPAELHQRIRCDYITIPFGMGKVKTQFALFCRKSKAAAFPAGAAVFFPSG